ncbi:histidine kinase N-terminal domain-containing protein [Peribacillus sp. SCS-155]|uniref:histidine kinase N-terminal domain-containing protein n=1 Tax=Peribacillus sedimenti TaxID=3115297 RepID=UPI003906552C
METPLLHKQRKILVQFLQKWEHRFLADWHQMIIVDELDPFKEQIKGNGLMMYQLITQTLKGTLSSEGLKKLAFKVAAERVQAGVNIGNFIYNVNLGRTIIINNILESDVPERDLKDIIAHINKQFDNFCYHAVSRFTDIKEMELQEKSLYISENHKDKLAVLGQISSSFVHEFRNPLTSIIGFNKLLKEQHPDLKYLDIMENELEQLNFRIAQFLHTSKSELNSVYERGISINSLFKDIQQLTYPSIVDTDVNVSAEYEGDYLISGNKDELRQVLLNLFVNSIEALKEQESPRNLFVRVHSTGRELVISIANNGPLIKPEHTRKIFEPFFTTKDLGTGIGLYVCKKIIEKQGGRIDCQSTPDLTTFSVYLPLAEYLHFSMNDATECMDVVEAPRG